MAAEGASPCPVLRCVPPGCAGRVGFVGGGDPVSLSDEQQGHGGEETDGSVSRGAQGPARYYDEHGLMVRVLPTGAKHWIWRGTVRGRRVDLGLGGMSPLPTATVAEPSS